MAYYEGTISINVDLSFDEDNNPFELDFECSLDCDESTHGSDPSNGGEEFTITYLPDGNAPAWLSDVIIEMAKVKAQDYFMNNLNKYRC